MTLALSLRQRVLHFVQALQAYMLCEVVEPAWHTMASAIAESTTVDAVLAAHTRFLDAALGGCMLTSPDLLLTVAKLLQLALRLAADLGAYAATAPGLLHERTAERRLTELDARFGSEMRALLAALVALGTSAAAAAVEARLDFNGYYAAAAASRPA